MVVDGRWVQEGVPGVKVICLEADRLYRQEYRLSGDQSWSIVVSRQKSIIVSRRKSIVGSQPSESSGRKANTEHNRATRRVYGAQRCYQAGLRGTTVLPGEYEAQRCYGAIRRGRSHLLRHVYDRRWAVSESGNFSATSTTGGGRCRKALLYKTRSAVVTGTPAGLQLWTLGSSSILERGNGRSRLQNGATEPDQ